MRSRLARVVLASSLAASALAQEAPKHGVVLHYTFDPSKAAGASQALARTTEVLKARLDAYGIAGARIASDERNGLTVRLPGLRKADVPAVRGLLERRGTVAFRLVADPADLEARGIDVDRERLRRAETEQAQEAARQRGESLAPYAGPGEKGFAWLYDEAGSTANGKGEFVKLDPGSGFDAASFRKVERTVDHVGASALLFELKPEDAKRMGALTAANLGDRLAIVIDGRIVSSPTIASPIEESGIIEKPGGFKDEEAKTLIVVLRHGPLAAAPTFVRDEEF